MKPLSEWTDAELYSEHSAAEYFANASYEREVIEKAEQRIAEIEQEWDRREIAVKERHGE